ncbi:MAG: HDOD domain-containing protein [Synergistaceae bacterium]|nr:HDOD domain-containing protein [Synergistaceae bacterium]
MKLFIVAVPLFNADIAVVAYELRYQSCEKLFGVGQSFESLDILLSSPGIELLDKVGLEPFTGGKPILIPVNKFLLLTNFHETISIEPKDLVCLLTDDIPIEDMYLERCRTLRDHGFRLALKNIKLTPETAPLFELASYYMIDTTNKDDLLHVMQIRKAHRGIQIVFVKIASKEVFESIKTTPASLFEGKFYSQPVTKGEHKLSTLKTSALELLQLVEDRDFDINAASSIIERDPSLSVSLLRFINSPAIGVVSKIRSISHAVSMLGQVETAKWIRVAVSMYMAEDKPNEVTKLSLTRARFAENLAALFGLARQAPTLFLMGIFSILDVVLDMPMEKAIASIPIDVDVKEALVSRTGKYADVINFMYGYEQADWEKCAYMMVLKDVDINEVNEAYLESLYWYRNILLGISQSLV